MAISDRRVAAAILFALAIVSPVRALEAAEPPPTQSPGPEGRRPLPDYDGRPDPPADAGEVLLWVPRVVVLPMYLLSEYVIRRPWGWTIRKFQDMREDAAPNDSFGIIPAFSLETDMRPSLGLMATWRRVGSRDNDLRFHVGFGGVDWLRALGALRVRLDRDATVRMRVEASRRPDQVYYGLGPDAPDELQSRYGADTLQGSFQFSGMVWPHLYLDAAAGIRGERFDAPECCDEPSVQESVLAGELERPPGFDGGTTWRQSLALGLDTRRKRGARETGLALDVDGTHVVDVEALGERDARWIIWGGSASGEVDVTGTERMLGLDVAVRFADPLGGGDVTFTDLPTLGGDESMRGFLPGRLRDRSAAVATLGWRYPLWPLLEAHFEVACGSVWGEHLDGFSGDDLRLSFGGGLRTDVPDNEDWLLELLVAGGTERFADGASPESLHIVFALTPRF